MKKTLFIAFVSAVAFLSLIPAGIADSWGSPKEMEAINNGMRAKAEKENQETAAIKKKWEADAPQREARQKKQEARERERAESEAAAEAAIPAADREEAFRKEILDGLKDPESARFRDVKFIGNGVVCGYVNAKNSFGGYVGFKPMCTGMRDRAGRPMPPI